jgi:aryl-alcohol dehydrogenase-like predicted oxidoreductase
MIRGPLGFGGASLPGLYTPIPAAQAHATVLHALASGVTHFDVAPRYGLGEAERRLGAVLSHCAEGSLHAVDEGWLGRIGRRSLAGFLA